MVNARHWPIGDHGNQICSFAHGRPKEFRKTKVVTDEWRQNKAAPRAHDHLLARLVILGFTAGRERLKFAIAEEQLGLWREDDRLVAAPASVGRADDSAHDKDIEVPGGARKKLL